MISFKNYCSSSANKLTYLARIVTSFIARRNRAFDFERAACAVFGLATFGVHMTGAYIRNPTCPVFVRDERS
jgi:hypothetical protein